MQNIEIETDLISDLSSLINDYNINIIDSKLDIYDIVNKYLEKNQGDDSFIIMDIGEIIRQYKKWKKLLPRIIPYYAIKCNPSPIILQILNRLGCNYDTASKGEISRVIENGISPDRIIFANPCKMLSQIKFARANDIDLMTFDSTHELYKIKLYHPNTDLLLRIKTDDSKSICRFNCKFGVDLEEVENILKIAKQLEINIKGVSFHVGSGCKDANVYNTALKDCKTVFEIANKLDIKMNLIDIGGGFPGIDNSDINFESITNIINDSINQLFNEMNEIKFIAEPGRYFVTSSHTLVTTIINKKEIIDKETNIKKYIYYVSDGIYGTFSGIIFDYAKIELLPFNERNEKTFSSIVYGPTCDSLDIITKDCQLPSLAIGESIIIKNIGAYSIASATEFNGFTKPEIYYILT
jgi:ornithine decarboxylase